MFNKKTLTIIKRELQVKLLSRSFILMTVLVPIFLFGIIGLQTLFVSIEGDENTSLKIFTEDNSINAELEKNFAESDAVKKDKYKITVGTIRKNELDNFLKNYKEDLLNNKITGIVFISSEALNNKEVQYYSKNPSSYSIFSKIGFTLNTV